jgi:glycosyltransferase involved in cell wall biosynthesis
VVVPSLVPETFGYVVLESFAQGRPVLGRDLGALPGILRSSGGGRTFDDQTSLLEQMNFYLNQPELADADGQRGHRAILSKYNEENHLNQYFQWINEALADRGRLLHEAHHETNSHHANEPKVA